MEKWLQRLERGSAYAALVAGRRKDGFVNASPTGVLQGRAAGGGEPALVFAAVMGAGQVGTSGQFSFLARGVASRFRAERTSGEQFLSPA